MEPTSEFNSPFEIFETIHREMLTLIAHCTFHRSLLQEIILRHADRAPDALAVLERWRSDSLDGIEKMRFSDLNKRDKLLATEVYREATRTAETFWNLLISQAARIDQPPPAQSSEGYDPYNHASRIVPHEPQQIVRG